jgi:two-component system, OmpR family, response regulator
MNSKLILVVDDDTAILDMLAELLSYEGYEVVTSSEGSVAVARAASEPPALILLDLMMPEMSGWQVIDALRASPRTGAIPVVLMSARRDLPATATELNVATFLEKPFDLDDLLGIVARYVHHNVSANPQNIPSPQ